MVHITLIGVKVGPLLKNMETIDLSVLDHTNVGPTYV